MLQSRLTRVSLSAVATGSTCAGLWLWNKNTHCGQVLPAVGFPWPPPDVRLAHGPVLSSEHEIHQLIAATLRQLVSSIPSTSGFSASVSPTWTLLVQDSSSPKAICSQKGNIIITTGMVEMIRRNAGTQRMPVDSVDVLAAVLGHEMGHALTHKLVARDRNIAGGVAAAIVAAAIPAIRSPSLSPLAVPAVGLPLAVCWYAFVHRQMQLRELACDAVGVRLLAAAGYNVDAVEAFFRFGPSHQAAAWEQASKVPVVTKDAHPLTAAEASSAVTLSHAAGAAASPPAGALSPEPLPLQNPLRWLLRSWRQAKDGVFWLLATHPRDAERAEAAAALAKELKAASS